MPRTMDQIATLNTLTSATLNDADRLIGRDASGSGTTEALSARLDELRTFFATVSQPLNAILTALAGLSPGADKLAYFTGASAMSLADLSAAARNLLDDSDASAMRTTLGLGTLATQNGTISDYATLASPTFTGTPAVPTAAQGTNTTQAASTAYVQTEIAALVASAPGALNTLDELAAALNDDANFASTVTTALSGKQPLDATLTALAGLTIAANSVSVGSGPDAFTQVTCAANTFLARGSTGNLVAKSITDFGLSLVDDANAAAARTTLGFPTFPTDDGYYVLEVDTGVLTWRRAAVSVYAEPSITVTTQGEDADMEQFSISGGNDETVSSSDGSTTADVLFDGSGNVLSVTSTPTNYTAGSTGSPSITFTSTIAGDRTDMSKSSGGGGSVSVDVQGTDGVAEVFEISFGGATGGTIRISGSDPINWDADAATVESTLEAALGVGVSVTGSNGEFEVTYDDAADRGDPTITENLLTI